MQQRVSFDGHSFAGEKKIDSGKQVSLSTYLFQQTVQWDGVFFFQQSLDLLGFVLHCSMLD